MAEVVFAKHFLATLDNRPIKLASDHVADPRKLPAQSAVRSPSRHPPFRATPRSVQLTLSRPSVHPPTSLKSLTIQARPHDHPLRLRHGLHLDQTNHHSFGLRPDTHTHATETPIERTGLDISRH